MPLFWLSLAFMAGVLAAHQMPLEGIYWLAIGAGCFLLGLLALLLQRRSRRASQSIPEQTRYLFPLFLFSLCTFVLGAGFSEQAGLPLATELTTLMFGKFKEYGLGEMLARSDSPRFLGA